MLRHTIFLFALFTAGIQSARILCFFPNPSKSHVLLALPIAEELAKRGHHLTVVTNHKHGLGGPNYTEVVIKSAELHGEVYEQMTSGKTAKGFSFIAGVVAQFSDTIVGTLQSPEFQKIMENDTFDLVFFINVFFNNYQIGLADHFHAPWVALTPMGNIQPVRELLGVPSLMTTVPSKFLELSPPMKFSCRLKNFFAATAELLITRYMEFKEKRLYRKLWPADKYRDIFDMKRNVSAVFLNGHWTESGKIRPTLPNEVDIGGIQIRANPKALEPEVQTFLDEAHDGAIVWTFGSNLPLSSIQPEKVKIMMKILGKLKVKVIMKWETDDTSKLPQNFMGRKWLAQDSILAHPNVKVFITHGGHGGCMEAMYHEVPILGIPFFGDQHGNVEKAVEGGWARGLKIDEITEENFSEAINDVLTNKTYRENVKWLSEKYRDRLNTPLDEAVFWMEYVLKYHGAPHVAYAGRNLNTAQYYGLDILTFFIASVIGAIFLTKETIRLFVFLYRKKYGEADEEEEKKSK